MDRIGFSSSLSEGSMKTSSSPCSFSLLKSSADYLSTSWNQSFSSSGAGWRLRRSSEAELSAGEDDVMMTAAAARKQASKKGRSTSLCYTSAAGTSVPKFSFLSESLGWSTENVLHEDKHHEPLSGSSLTHQPGGFFQSFVEARPRASLHHQHQPAFKTEAEKQDVKNECKQVFFDCAM